MKYFTAMLAMALCLPSAAMAQSGCAPTPALPAVNYPGAAKIVPSNDLTRAAGKGAALTDGEPLLLQGQVLDKSCMPVAGMLVEIWQTNPYGAWRLPTDADRVSATPVFNGAGRTYTDENGRFTFRTLFPGPVKGQAPRINICAYPPQAPFSTILFFADDGRNAADPLFKRLKPEAQQQVTLGMQQGQNGFVAQATLVLPVKASYQTY